jgi:hypothetical protein
LTQRSLHYASFERFHCAMPRSALKLKRTNTLSVRPKKPANVQKKLPPGPERDALLKKTRQAEVTEQWLSSPGWKPPK